MLTFTIRPTVNWTISYSSYQKGTIKELYSNTTYASQGTTSPHSERVGVTDYGHTQDNVDARTFRSLRESHYGESGFSYIDITDRSATASGAVFYDPSTGVVHHAADSGPPPVASYNEAVTYDYTQAYTLDEGFTEHDYQTLGDTYRASTRGTTATRHEVSEGPGGGYDTAKTDTVTDISTLPATTYTQNGTSFHIITEAQTAYYKEYTATFSDGIINFVSTSTYTLATTHTSMPTSSWNTCMSYISDQPTTRLSYDEVDSNAVTYAADTTANYTHLSGTSTVNDTTWLRTNHYFDGLEDTVILMNANRGTDFNLSGVLWKFALSALAYNSSSAGRFTDLFESVEGDTITIADYSRFDTVSVEMSGITISVGTAIYTDETGGTHTHYRTSYNGVYYPTVTSVSTDSTGGTHNYTLPPVITTSDSRTFNLSGVASLLSTYYTETDHTSPVVSQTLFTHTVQTSEYRRSDSSWITGTTTSTWVSATVSTFARDKRYQPATTTHRVSYRGTTTDEILVSKFSVTGTITVYLGMEKKTTTRVISLERIDTISTYHANFHEELRQYTSTAAYDDVEYLGGGDSDHPATYDEPDGSGGTRNRTHAGVNRGSSIEVWADEIDVTKYTEYKLGPKIYRKPINFNYTQENRAVFRALPVGWAGFGGSFDASELSVWRTTTEGLQAGSTFSSDQRVFLIGPVSAVNLVNMFAIHSKIAIGGGAERASIISIPDGMTSNISIAATWTSTTATTKLGGGTTSTITSRFATHTIAVTDSIGGSFWTSEAMNIDNGYRVGLDPNGSFAGSVGFGVGKNVMESSYQIILDAGYVEWTEYSERDSSGVGATGSASGSNGSVSFSVPWSHAIIFKAENLLTVKWERGVENENYFFSLPYLPTES